MTYYDEYKRWRGYEAMDPALKQELDSIENIEEEIRDRFGRSLNFGTGGIRGRMGAGPGRINIYLIRQATLGLARYLKTVHPDKKNLSVCIAYDTRENSARFARETAGVLAYEGIQARLFPQPTPTPMLSYAVRELAADAGVVITASHNPPSDNGYKVYGPDGGQITDGFAKAVMAQIAAVTDELAVPVAEFAEAEGKGLICWVDPEVEERYLQQVCAISLRKGWGAEKTLPIRVVYTPLHGTGARFGPEILKRSGMMNVYPVPEQMIMDPACPTVKYPNPEDFDVFQLAIQLGIKEGAELLLATDLDGDRLGAVVRNKEGDYVPLTGNQLGCLMLDYLLSQRRKNGTLPPNGMMVQTVVTSGLGKAIASAYGIETVETLTGFKYIGEVIKERGDSHKNVFLFGYEESYGYLAGDFVRDKDAFQAILLAAEITVFHQSQGNSLLDALEAIYKRFGYFMEELMNIDLPPGDIARVEGIMGRFRQEEIKRLGGSPVVTVFDYLYRTEKNMSDGKTREVMLPSNNSLKYVALDGSWFCIRPSGTEPKMKLYVGVVGADQEDSQKKMLALRNEIVQLIGI